MIKIKILMLFSFFVFTTIASELKMSQPLTPDEVSTFISFFKLEEKLIKSKNYIKNIALENKSFQLMTDHNAVISHIFDAKSKEEVDLVLKDHYKKILSEYTKDITQISLDDLIKERIKCYLVYNQYQLDKSLNAYKKLKQKEAFKIFWEESELLKQDDKSIELSILYNNTISSTMEAQTKDEVDALFEQFFKKLFSGQFMSDTELNKLMENRVRIYDEKYPYKKDKELKKIKKLKTKEAFGISMAEIELSKLSEQWIMENYNLLVSKIFDAHNKNEVNTLLKDYYKMLFNKYILNKDDANLIDVLKENRLNYYNKLHPDYFDDYKEEKMTEAFRFFWAESKLLDIILTSKAII